MITKRRRTTANPQVPTASGEGMAHAGGRPKADAGPPFMPGASDVLEAMLKYVADLTARREFESGVDHGRAAALLSDSDALNQAEARRLLVETHRVLDEVERITFGFPTGR